MVDSVVHVPVPETRVGVDAPTACSLLEDGCRRRVLRTLATESGTTTRRDLARALARDDRRTREQVEAALYHTHLPKLADAHAIRYDHDAETVALTDAGEQLLRCLDAIERELGARR